MLSSTGSARFFPSKFHADTCIIDESTPIFNSGPIPTMPTWAFGLWFCWYGAPRHAALRHVHMQYCVRVCALSCVSTCRSNGCCSTWQSPYLPPPTHVYMHACTPIIKSRYHPYNQTEKTAEVQHFLDDDLGLDVVSLDRNWRNLGLPAEGTHCPTGFLT